MYTYPQINIIKINIVDKCFQVHNNISRKSFEQTMSLVVFLFIFILINMIILMNIIIYFISKNICTSIEKIISHISVVYYTR